MNHHQTINMRTPPPKANVRRYHLKNNSHSETVNDWIILAKHILIHIQLRDNLEKTVLVVWDYYDGNERRILLKPKSLEEGSFA